ncbi:MAG: DMT family transporter [Pseudomonadota bacterium]
MTDGPHTSAQSDTSRADTLRGIVLIVLASCFAVASSALTKALSETFPSLQIVWVRAVVTLVCLLPFLLRSRFAGLWPARPALMTFRSFNAAVIIVLNIYAVGRLPLVDFTAIGFTTPLFVIGLSFFILGDKPQLKRSLATLLGFAGVMMIVRPTGAVSLGLVAAIGGAFCLGLGVLLIRLLSRTEGQVRLMLWSNGLLVLLMGVPAYTLWVPPNAAEIGLLIAAGLAGTLTQAFILMAYEVGEPTVIAPFDYSRILIAVAVGFAFFGEVPDVLTFVGAALIIGAGLFIARMRSSPA